MYSPFWQLKMFVTWHKTLYRRYFKNLSQKFFVRFLFKNLEINLKKSFNGLKHIESISTVLVHSIDRSAQLGPSLQTLGSKHRSIFLNWNCLAKENADAFLQFNFNYWKWQKCYFYRTIAHCYMHLEDLHKLNFWIFGGLLRP